MFEVFKEFSFDAAHHLATNVENDHPYARIHGHSFTVMVIVRGQPDPKTNWVVDVAELEKALKVVHGELDHRCLNDIQGLEIPTLENICTWIWRHLKPQFPLLYRVTVKRGTLGEGCTYQEMP